MIFLHRFTPSRCDSYPKTTRLIARQTPSTAFPSSQPSMTLLTHSINGWKHFLSIITRNAWKGTPYINTVASSSVTVIPYFLETYQNAIPSFERWSIQHCVTWLAELWSVAGIPTVKVRRLWGHSRRRKSDRSISTPMAETEGYFIGRGRCLRKRHRQSHQRERRRWNRRRRTRRRRRRVPEQRITWLCLVIGGFRGRRLWERMEQSGLGIASW